MPIPTVDSTKKTASTKLKRGDPDSLTLWFEKVAVKVYQHHHHPLDNQSLTVLINLPLLFHSRSLCICKWRGSYSEGMPSLSSALMPLLDSLRARLRGCACLPSQINVPFSNKVEELQNVLFVLFRLELK